MVAPNCTKISFFPVVCDQNRFVANRLRTTGLHFGHNFIVFVCSIRMMKRMELRRRSGPQSMRPTMEEEELEALKEWR